jgi:cell wall-associated NlpC family hydrolase
VTERATGRHRASHRSSTPLSTLTGPLSVVGDYVGTVRRSGVIIAMSSGLVASMALPAHAVNTEPEAAGPATASIPAIPADAAGSALFTAPAGGLLALPPDLVADTGTVAAPAAAMIDFDHSSFALDAPGRSPSGLQTPSTDEEDQAGAEDVSTDAPKTVTKPAPPKRKDLRQAGSGSRTVTAKPAAAVTKAKPATAPASSDTSGESTTTVADSSLGGKAVAIAFRYEGTPYLWGGTTPRGFDCSGFTRYVYGQLGKQLGRTVASQRGDVKFVKRSQAKAGDLVFFGNGHIGIYLGNNRMIDSPRRGKSIQDREIYSSNVQFGRVV